MNSQQAALMLLKILENNKISVEEILVATKTLSAEEWFALEGRIGDAHKNLTDFTKQELAELEIWCFEKGAAKAATFQEWGIIYHWLQNMENHFKKAYSYTLSKEKKESFTRLKKKAYEEVLRQADDQVNSLDSVIERLGPKDELSQALARKLPDLKKTRCEVCGKIVEPNNDARIFHLLLENIPQLDAINTPEQVQAIPGYQEMMEIRPRHILPITTMLSAYIGKIICPGSPTRQLWLQTCEDARQVLQKMQQIFPAKKTSEK